MSKAWRPGLPRVEAFTIGDAGGFGVWRDNILLAWFRSEELANEWIKIRAQAAYRAMMDFVKYESLDADS